MAGYALDLVMDRQTWLAERRAAVELDYTRDAARYEVGNYPISETHRSFVDRVVEACPSNGIVLDMPCGTGALLRARRPLRQAGESSAPTNRQGMVEARPRTSAPTGAVEQVGLQELAEREPPSTACCASTRWSTSHPKSWLSAVANTSAPPPPASRHSPSTSRSKFLGDQAASSRPGHTPTTVVGTRA